MVSLISASKMLREISTFVYLSSSTFPFIPKIYPMPTTNPGILLLPKDQKAACFQYLPLLPVTNKNADYVLADNSHSTEI